MPQERMTVEQYRKEMGLDPIQTSKTWGRTKNKSGSVDGFSCETKPEPGAKQRASKYNARKTKVDGLTFASKLEADYYCELKIKQQAGEIFGFCRQPEFVLQDGEGMVIRYKPDFIVFTASGAIVVEVKGKETTDWAIRDKLFRARFPHISLIVDK